MTDETVLVLRSSNADGTSRNGFKWPLKVGAIVKCPDWKPTKECGNGLHGLLHGAGDGSLLNWNADAKWYALEVKLSSIVMLGGKCKFPEAKIAYVGDRKGATDYIMARVTKPELVVGAFRLCGDNECVSGGNRATVSGGDCATVSGGDYATVSGGYCAQIRINWYDENHNRYRTAIAYVGEDGIKPNVKYRLNEKHEFEEVK